MAYTDVISLNEVKEFLRLETFLIENDNELTSMLNAACAYVEEKTNHILFARDKEYILYEGCKRVYDYPINSVVAPTSPDDYKATLRQNYTIYDVYDADLQNITLNVGYTDPANVPYQVKQVVLAMVNFLYYGKGESEVKGEYPMTIHKQLNSITRFIL